MTFKYKLWLSKAFDFAKRNGVWLLLAAAALILLSPTSAMISTLLMLVLVEATALALSGIAAYSYTKVDFSRQQMWNTLGSIFLGVHICLGLVVMGVYFAQV